MKSWIFRVWDEQVELGGRLQRRIDSATHINKLRSYPPVPQPASLIDWVLLRDV